MSWHCRNACLLWTTSSPFTTSSSSPGRRFIFLVLLPTLIDVGTPSNVLFAVESICVCSVIIFTTCLSQCILAHSAMSRDRTKMFIHGVGVGWDVGDCARGWAACQYPHHQYGQKLYFISDVTFFRLLIMSKTSSLL